MSNYHGQGVPYGIPRFQSPPESPARVGTQPQQPPQPNTLRKQPPGNFSRGPARQTQQQQQQQPQWPLPADQSPASAYTPSAYNQSPRGAPPQRPPRPAGALPAQPPRSASDKSAYTSASIPQYSNRPPNPASSVYSGPGVWSDEGYDSMPSPNQLRPKTGASSASTSSYYSVPDAPPSVPHQALPPIPAEFQPSRAPIPMPTTSPRARAPLGPPPSARRGPPSYYPLQNEAHVTPIVEESDSQKGSTRGSLRPGDGSRGSYASSNAIPIGVPDYYLQNNSVASFADHPHHDSFASDYDNPPVIDVFPPPPAMMANGRVSDSAPAIVRQASIGKRSKPSLTTIKPGEHVKSNLGIQRNYSDESFEDDRMQTLPPTERHLQTDESYSTFDKTLASEDSKGNLSRRTGSSGAMVYDDTTFYHRSSSDSDKSDFTYYKGQDYSDEPMPDVATLQRANTQDNRQVDSILNRLEKGGVIAAGEEKGGLTDQPSSLSQRVGTRRPPRLNVDAVREAEQRGSLTSLPDLIRRATKLASNLDRGKTASRLDFDWFPGDARDKARDYDEKRRSAGSLSDMLSAFPPPAVGTPRSQNGRFQWPSGLRLSTHPGNNGDGRSRQRQGAGRQRCCGMPFWAFMLLIVLLILLIAAAVIVPVVLIVIPRQAQQSTPTTLAACHATMSCSNGGAAFFGPDKSCRCICVNGFTGTTCSISSGADCSGISVNGAANATVGNAIPRLLSAAKNNFSIPLDGSEIVSLLASANFSCASQNALVAFNGLSTRSVPVHLAVEQPESSGEATARTPTRTLKARRDAAAAAAPAASSNIVIALDPSTLDTPSTRPNSTSSLDLDFARTAILFVLQNSAQVNDAVAAQNAFQRWFSNESAPGTVGTNITLDNGFSANLNRRLIVLGNGTRVGGGGQ